MKYVKENLDVVICGAIALITLVLCYWPTSSWDATLQETMTQRYGQGKVASGLVQTVEVIPGGLKLPNATYEQNAIDAKKKALDLMKSQAAGVANHAASLNLKNRVRLVKTGNTTPDKVIPMLSDGREEDNYLPAPAADGPKADTFRFKADYERQFPVWMQKLNGGTPPTPNELTDLVNARVKELVAQAAAVGRVMGGAGAAGTPNQLSTKESNQIKRNAVSARAGKIWCYVDDGALQKRDWFGRSAPPNEQQIFEALVDSWFQQDVVSAISGLNKKVLDKQTEKNVGRAPVKRLVSILIGNAAVGGASSGGPGMLFFGGPTMGPNGTPMAAAGGSGLALDRSLTGHVGTSEYDVVLMKITVDIDPAYENQLIDALYRQNNGYTVINRNMRTVDPLEAASNGYLYGPVQCERLELLVEGLLFRSWTLPLMPDGIRKQLGLPPLPPPGTPGAGGTPGRM